MVVFMRMLPSQFVIDSLQSVLDVTETSVLLEAVVKNIITVAKHSPQLLGRHFQVSHIPNTKR